MYFSFEKIRKFDVLVFGRAGMDLYPDPAGTKTKDATHFVSDMGGSAGNTAVSLAKYGKKVSLLTAISDDPIGDFVKNKLTHYGVDFTDCVTIGGEARTSLALVETRPEDCASIIYRNGAVDLMFDEANVNADLVKNAGILVLSGTALALEPSRSATMKLLKLANENGCKTILDIDYRPYSWVTPEDAKQTYVAASKLCDMVVGNDEEFAIMCGDIEHSEQFAKQWSNQNDCTTIYKMGSKGSITFHEGRHFNTGIFPVITKKPFGAGDAFMGALVAAIVDGKLLKTAVKRGSAAAAIVVSTIGCSAAMPTTQQLDDFMSDNQLISNNQLEEA